MEIYAWWKKRGLSLMPLIWVTFCFGLAAGLVVSSCSDDSKKSQAPVVKDDKLPDIQWDFDRIDLKMEKATNIINPKMEKTIGNRPTPKAYNNYLMSGDCREIYQKFFQQDARCFAFIYNPDMAFNPQSLDSIPTDTLHAKMSEALCHFVSGKSIEKLIGEIKKRYPENYDFKTLLEKPFQRMEKNLPGFKTPKIRTFASGYDSHTDWPEQYGYGRLTVNKEYCAISLDYYGGDKFPIIHPGIPKYLLRRCNATHLPREIAYEYLNFYLPPPTARTTPTLLELMITEGKKLYGLDLILPEAHDTVKFMCTKAQLEISNNNIALIYKKLLPDLFSQNFKQYEWALNEGPFTHPSRLGSNVYPSRLGVFIGWQIVRAYMASHPDISFEQLIKEKDYKKILEQSNFKPNISN